VTVGSASYRDPENAAVVVDGAWYRVAAPESAAALTVLRESELYAALVAEGSLVRFDEAEQPVAQVALNLHSAATGRDPVAGSRVFAVETVDLITYPWEWPNSLLGAAGLLTLDIRARLLEIGLDLKDASAFNIQFRGMRPVLIDLGSIQSWRPNPSWNAARQYIEHFVNPLAVGAGDTVTAADAWELSHRRGLRSEVARSIMPGGQRRRPSLWVLQASTRPVAKHEPVETKYAEQAKRDSGLALRATQSLTRKLRKQTLRVSGADHTSTWQDYGSRDHYGTDELQHKLELTRDFIGAAGRGRLVLDIGGNDGLAAADLAQQVGARVIVLDPDAGALDVLSRSLGATPEILGQVTALYGDLTNLTAASGLLDGEFAAFTDRVRPSAVLCQAVLHHIVITQGVPMALAVQALARFGAPTLVEFATPEDPKVAILLSQIPNWTGNYSTESLIDALNEHYTDVAVVGRTSQTRVVVTTGNPRA